MLLSTICLLSALATPQEPELRPTPTVLDRVTVYSGQALVERVFTVEATEPGPLTAEIGPLPLALEVSSFQTKVEGGDAVIQGVETRIVTGDALEMGERDRLRARLAELSQQRRELESELASIEAGQKMVASVIASLAAREGGVNVLEAAVSGESLDALFSFVRDRSAELDGELAAYEASRLRLDQEIAEVREQLGGESGAPLRRYHLGRIQVWAERPGPIQLRASYLIAGASWMPTYDVRVAPDLTGVTVGLVAELRQRTGEDWSEAEILLSTSTPSVGLDPPELPLRVYEALSARRPSAALGAEMRGLGNIEMDSLAGGASEPSWAAYKDAYLAAPEVQIQDLGLSALFQLPDRKTIRGDGEPYRFRIREVPLEVRPGRYLVPTRSERAFLRAPTRLRVFVSASWGGSKPQLVTQLMTQGE